MERGVTYRSLIEYFLMMQEGGSDDKLVYYDHSGTKIEKSVERGQIDKALGCFNSGPRAVSRTSGGMALAVPYQLVVFAESPEATPEIRVKVKFREFKRGPEGVADGDSYVIGTKIVSPDELQESFSYRLDGEQRFAIDFGRGLVPVYVIRFAKSPTGRTIALFIDHQDKEKLVNMSRGTRIPIQVYAVARDVLRFLPKTGEGQDDLYHEITAAYRMKKAEGMSVLPQAFAFEEAIETPTELSHQDIRHYLSRALKKSQNGRLQIETRTGVETTSKGLVPFGTWEI